MSWLIISCKIVSQPLIEHDIYTTRKIHCLTRENGASFNYCRPSKKLFAAIGQAQGRYTLLHLLNIKIRSYLGLDIFLDKRVQFPISPFRITVCKQGGSTLASMHLIPYDVVYGKTPTPLISYNFWNGKDEKWIKWMKCTGKREGIRMLKPLKDDGDMAKECMKLQTTERESQLKELASSKS